MSNAEQIIKTIPEHVQLVAVTKMHEKDEIEQLYQLGIRHFGENKLQELVRKKVDFPDCNWHFIGRIQSNKIKQIVRESYLIHSVSSLKHLQKIDDEAQKINKNQNILLQFNLANEQTKAGFNLEDLAHIYDLLPSLSATTICGIMIIGNHSDDLNAIEDTFQHGFQLYTHLHSQIDTVNTLSMGMSGDYQLAIKHGSTCVRIGSKLFK